MKGIDAGAMDREIVLQTATKAQDEDTNEEVVTWAGETVWAQWLPAGSTEVWRAQQRIESLIDGIFRIYDRTPRPTPDATQVVFDGRTYDIKGVIEIGRGDGLDLVAVAHGEVDA